MNGRIRSDGHGRRGVDRVNIGGKEAEREGANSSPLGQRLSSIWNGLGKYKRTGNSLSAQHGTNPGEAREVPTGALNFAPESDGDAAPVVVQGDATNWQGAVLGLPDPDTVPRLTSNDRGLLQSVAQAVPRVVESVDATLHEARRALILARSDVCTAGQDRERATAIHKGASERIVEWYTRAVLDEMQGRFPAEIGPLDDVFAARVAEWLREPTLEGIGELADYGVGVVGADVPFERLMEQALEHAKPDKNPEVSRLHDAERVAFLKWTQSAKTSRALEAHATRLEERVLKLQDVSAMAHMTNQAVAAARDANALVAEGEVDTPAAEHARDLTQHADEMLAALSATFGAYNDALRG
jgi:hypothetical protein